MPKRRLHSKSAEELTALTKNAVILAKQRQLESLSEDDLHAVQGGAIAIEDVIKGGQTEGYVPRDMIKQLSQLS